METHAMDISDLLVRRCRSAGSAALAEKYRRKAAQLRAEAIDPGNIRRRLLLFYVAHEYEMSADRAAETADRERLEAVRVRILDRRRRVRAVARTYRARAE